MEFMLISVPIVIAVIQLIIDLTVKSDTVKNYSDIVFSVLIVCLVGLYVFLIGPMYMDSSFKEFYVTGRTRYSIYFILIFILTVLVYGTKTVIDVKKIISKK